MKKEIVANAVVTKRGKVLLGRKKEEEGHPVSGQLHFPGGYLEKGEEPEETVKREVMEETGLEVEVHQLIDVTAGNFTDKEVPMRIIFHCETDKIEAEPLDDLVEVEWVPASKVYEKAGQMEKDMIDARPKVQNFLRKLEKMPSI